MRDDVGSAAGVLAERVMNATSSPARDLHYLRAIEDTLGLLNFDTDFYHLVARHCGDESRRLQTKPFDRPIDKTGSLETKLLKAQNALKELHERLMRCCSGAQDDPYLRDDDGIVDAFRRCITATVQAHNGFNDLRWTIIEHDALLFKPVKPFSSLQALISDLNANVGPSHSVDNGVGNK